MSTYRKLVAFVDDDKFDLIIFEAKNNDMYVSLSLNSKSHDFIYVQWTFGSLYPTTINDFYYPSNNLSMMGVSFLKCNNHL